ncbi:prolyl-tRNA synthetase associated domain-containing 1-like protein [Labeo rohita]|uniref:Prolyl-tRNA synthetase associated domain-containing protein 1 n=2 Tax=Labeo rohita TaxID=84645 RepID=A0ABQ8M392_LABRO|nr:prolyl-tRNA synthetase associated domain-containing protein 1 [Labeo rohita]KAI2657368.1 Prolyl-tRNA synthetase associated domain-containing protein 1 [Labeo rohita]RXN03415.1 prolyl-tRNA synthetase associated domain-containing 1-like protein [Labeo rohita]
MASVELRTELDELLKRLDIDTICIDHPEVFTVEEMMLHMAHVSGVVAKNLFLKDKKKKGLWLLSVRHDRQVNLGDVAKRLGLGTLRLADESVMLEKLKVGQGCATALALFCDTDRSVKMVLDRDLTHGGHERVYFHPMTNSASLGLKPDDLLRFLEETGHEPVILSFD